MLLTGCNEDLTANRGDRKEEGGTSREKKAEVGKLKATQKWTDMDQNGVEKGIELAM